jgi:3-oxoacyl-[acyl-carrier-protein] synthase II
LIFLDMHGIKFQNDWRGSILPNPVVIGVDMVSALGVDLEDQFAAASEGESGIGPLTRFDLRDDFPVTIAGQVEPFDTSKYEFLRPRKMAHWTSPIFSHGQLVAHRALERAGIHINHELAPRVATTFSTAIGGLDAVIQADRIMVESGKLPMPYVNPNSCVNMIAGKISILTGATGPITTTIAACATGCSSMIVGALYIQAGMADVAICGAVDFPLIEPIVAGFATMNGAFKTKPNQTLTAQSASRPFANNRHGFVISEGAGCIILASKEFALHHGLSYQIELAGWSSTADANHFVAPNHKTVARCMSQAIAHAGIKPQDISAINAHAASTKVGDQIEADCLTEVFGKHVPPVSANKSMIGHAMGASSAIESILALEGMKQNKLLPTINYGMNGQEEIVLDCVQEGVRHLDQEYVLKNSFGFGGCNACLVFKRVH